MRGLTGLPEFPEALACQRSTGDERTQLRPDDRRMNAPGEGALRKAIIGARDHIFAAHNISEPYNTHDNQFGMLDIGRSFGDAVERYVDDFYPTFVPSPINLQAASLTFQRCHK